MLSIECPFKCPISSLWKGPLSLLLVGSFTFVVVFSGAPFSYMLIQGEGERERVKSILVYKRTKPWPAVCLTELTPRFASLPKPPTPLCTAFLPIQRYKKTEIWITGIWQGKLFWWMEQISTNILFNLAFPIPDLLFWLSLNCDLHVKCRILKNCPIIICVCWSTTRCEATMQVGSASLLGFNFTAAGRRSPYATGL